MTTTRSKRDAKDYANENVVHAIKILEALEGTNFEPVSIQRIAERTGIHYQKVRRVLLTLELLGWAQDNKKNEWSPGSKLLRFSNRYNEVFMAQLNK